MTTTEQFQRYFEKVAESMSQLPIFNADLNVALVEVEPSNYLVEGYDVAVLITPWCMNLVLRPVDLTDSWSQEQIGHKKIVTFPSGDYEFIFNWNEVLSGYFSCSLFSPMREFDSQEIALATANAVVSELFCEANLALTDKQIAERERQAEQQSEHHKGRPEGCSASGDNSSAVKDKKLLSRRGFLSAGLSQVGTR